MHQPGAVAASRPDPRQDLNAHRHPSRRHRLFLRLEPLLLWLWKVLPIPGRVRQAYLELIYPRFLLGVVALIKDEQGRILIVDHTYRRRGSWGLPGGYLQDREDPAAGLAREIGEEIGLEVKIGPIVAASAYKGYELNLLYRVDVTGGSLRRSAEVRGWRFVSPAELEGLMPHQLQMLRWAGEVADEGRSSEF